MATYVKDKCPVCEHNKHNVIGEIRKNNSPVSIPDGSSIVACKQCRLIFVNPIPRWDADDFAKLYNEDYFTFLESDDQKKWFDIRERVNPRKRYDRASRRIESKQKKMLEIGAGEYAFMSRFMISNGWDVTAQEPGVEFAKKLRLIPGLKLETRDILELDESQKYSFIFADSVLEHVSNPVEYVKKLSNLLCPGGVFYNVSPNEYSMYNFIMNVVARMKGDNPHYIAPYKQPYHILGFTKKSLRILGEKSGLTLHSYKKIDDYQAFHVLNSKKSAVIKYPVALLCAISQGIGWGTNGESLFIKTDQ
jgi:2-polyprenyl-3-methyl-5-hydroxy-6-metoxy-1,4-benzoquinol methylase